MTDFDPEHSPTTKEEWDEYIRWCADELMLFTENPLTPRTYRTGYSCAGKMLVIVGSQLRLDPTTEDFDRVMRNLAGLVTTGRCFERAHPHIDHMKAMTARAVLDCWEPVGRSAAELLEAGKCAAAALILTMVHPLENPWEIDAPDVWTLVLMGMTQLDAIEAPAAEEDYMVTVNTTVTDLMYYQKANGISRSLGGGDLSAN